MEASIPRGGHLLTLKRGIVNFEPGNTAAMHQHTTNKLASHTWRLWCSAQCAQVQVSKAQGCGKRCKTDRFHCFHRFRFPLGTVGRRQSNRHLRVLNLVWDCDSVFRSNQSTRSSIFSVNDCAAAELQTWWDRFHFRFLPFPVTLQEADGR